MLSFGRFQAALAICALFAGVGARAETLTVRGVNAPAAAIPSDVELIVIERFEGDMGQDVEFALAQALADIELRDQPWFDIVTPEAIQDVLIEVAAEDGSTIRQALVADAQLRGTVRSEFLERDLDPKLVRDCAKRDDDRKCIEYKETLFACSELTVRVDPRIVLRGADGRAIYTHSVPQSETHSWCADDYSIPSALEISDRMVGTTVAIVRRDLAPSAWSRQVRIMETRRGLARDDRNAFRDAVRITDNDPLAACLSFEALEANNSGHLSVLFNIGLCMEASSRLDLAIDYYNRAREVDPDHSYPRDGLARVRSRQRGEAFVAERFGA